MSGGGLAYDRYRLGGRDEWMMRIGAADAPPLLFIPPLFEEMNRTRAFMATMMRALTYRGFRCWLIDLPGTGESERPLQECSWENWRDAVRTVSEDLGAGRDLTTVAFRGGCLLDEAAAAGCRWRFAPADGAALRRDLERAGMMSGGGYAGYDPHPALLDDIAGAKPAALAATRTVRLSTDRAEADFRAEGAALWRRSEPANAPDLAEALAADVASWVPTCGA